MFRVALHEPEIPYNAGNISRLCVGTQCDLILVGEPSFSLDDAKLRRAGLDHWDDLVLWRLGDLAMLEAGFDVVSFSTFGKRLFWEHEFRRGQVLLFGGETRGLPREWIDRHADRTYALPLPGAARSLNLSNAVAAVVYEGLRQLHAAGEPLAPPRHPTGLREYFDMRPHDRGDREG